MNGEHLERCLVNLAYKLVEEEILKPSPRFASHAEFAKIAFPNNANPINTWQTTRNGQKGKPRSLSVREAADIASALGKSLDTLVTMALGSMANGWTIDQDIFYSETGKTGGRPRLKKDPEPTPEPSNTKARTA